MSLKLISISVIDCVALNCSLNDVTPAPTISVPETAAFVAVPLVELNAKFQASVCPAAVVIPIKALCIKILVGVTKSSGASTFNVPSSTRQSPSA